MAGIKNDVERVDRQLRLFSETLDAWVACQKSWMYLECIFAAPDIQRQLPHEGKAFAQVDKHFRETMRRTHDRPNALLAVTVSGGDSIGGVTCLSTCLCNSQHMWEDEALGHSGEATHSAHLGSSLCTLGLEALRHPGDALSAHLGSNVHGDTSGSLPFRQGA